MPRVEVKLYGIFRHISGRKTLHVTLQNDATLGKLIDRIVEECGEDFKNALIDPRINAPKEYLNLLINGRHNRFLNGLDTKLNEGDVIDILMPAIGGCKTTATLQSSENIL